MKEVLIGNKKIYYEEHLDGGGFHFGIESLKNPLVMDCLKRGKILEMCCGPAFMGFYLNFEGLADELFLIDINEENKYFIDQTVKKNKLENTKFILSNVFDTFKENIIFDTIIVNPPHFKEIKYDFHKQKHHKLISLDIEWEFHKKFFNTVHDFMDKKTKIIIIEHTKEMSVKEMRNLLKETELQIKNITTVFRGYTAYIIEKKTI